MLSPTAKSPPRQQRKWTRSEDQKLRQEVEAQMSEGEVKDWCRIATKLPGRTNKDCRKRWHNSVIDGLKKGQWSKTEDVQLAKGVHQYGQRWTLVASIVGTRSADQCAKRWQQSLDPELDRSEWSGVEDKLLIQAVQKFGRHWKDLQRLHFAGRSKNCIKNRYTVLIRRYQNQGIALPPPPASPDISVSIYNTDDDDMSYTSSAPDDYPPTHTQGSTPETQHSWPVEMKPFSDWTSPDTFQPVSVQQATPVAHTTSPQWSSWTPATATMSPPPIMHFAPHQGYFSMPSDPLTLPAAYNVYGAGGPPAMLSPSRSHPSGSHAPGRGQGGPTSSPVARAVGIAPYVAAASHAHHGLLPPFGRYGEQQQQASFFQY